MTIKLKITILGTAGTLALAAGLFSGFSGGNEQINIGGASVAPVEAKFTDVLALQGADKNNCKALRAEIYPRYQANGDAYLSADWKAAVDFRAAMATKLGIDYGNYIFDLKSCAFLPKKANGMMKYPLKDYRTYVGV